MIKYKTGIITCLLVSMYSPNCLKLVAALSFVVLIKKIDHWELKWVISQVDTGQKLKLCPKPTIK